MRVRLLVVAGLMAAGVSSVRAQAAQCTSAPVAAQDACNTAIDFFQYMAPQLGISITGGNTILSQGGSTGGLPHFSLGVRANLVAGNLPTLQTPSATGPVFRTKANPYPTKDQYIGLPAVDATVGLFAGVPLGVTRVGGVDLLLSASYVPAVKTTEVSIEPDSPFKFGYGARVGLLQESLFIPGVGVSYMMRDLPTTSITGTVGTDSLLVTGLALKTTSWRVTAAKSLVLLTLAVGYGQDKYDASTGIEAIVNRPIIGRVTTGPLTATQKVTRTNYFADVSINLIVAKLIAEAGMISGGDIKTSNVFDVAGDVSRIYGSVGLRIGY